jgi:plastocyanin
MTKMLVIFIGLLVAVGVGVAVATLTNKPSDDNGNQGSEITTSQTSENENTQEQANEQSIEGQTVTFNGGAYSPNELTVKTGTAVTFKNEADHAIWPASNVHPTHTLYSGFDPRQQINPGEEWSFTFNRTGTWGYHDHLQSNITGTIIVK